MQIDEQLKINKCEYQDLYDLQLTIRSFFADDHNSTYFKMVFIKKKNFNIVFWEVTLRSIHCLFIVNIHIHIHSHAK